MRFKKVGEEQGKSICIALCELPMALFKCASSVTVHNFTGYTRLGSCLWRPCETPLFSLGSSFAQDFPHAPDKLELSASHAKLGRIWHVRAGDMPTSSAAGASAAWGARMRKGWRHVSPGWVRKLKSLVVSGHTTGSRRPSCDIARAAEPMGASGR